MDPRLKDIYFHAGRLFNTKRYTNTKVSDIAKAAGIATGSIYNLFKGKKAILTFVIRVSFDKEYLTGDIAIPIKEEDPQFLLKLFREYLKNSHFIRNVGGEVHYGFVDYISDLFDIHADILLATNNIEHNADLFPELADEFFRIKEGHFSEMENMLVAYMNAGEIRQLSYPRVHIQCITDILTWWAMNAFIALPDISVPRETAKKIAVDLVLRAYTVK